MKERGRPAENHSMTTLWKLKRREFPGGREQSCQMSYSLRKEIWKIVTHWRLS